MSYQVTSLRGSVPVSRLDVLPDAELCLICYLRLWNPSRSTGGAWAATAPEVVEGLGTEFLQQFDELLLLLSSHGRRPLMRHAADCRCVGADEAVFAHFVMTAATGAREDAMLMATLLVRADMAPLVLSQAQGIGLSVLRATDARRNWHAPGGHC